MIANTRVYQHHHLDSTRWDAVPYRNDDIVITTPYKCGTTWTQQITCALLHGPDVTYTREMSPWIDARFWGPIEPIAAASAKQPGPRFFKSHLPLDGIRWDDEVRFLVIGRDLRDVFMSLLNHYSAYGDIAMERLNDDSNPGAPIPRFDGDVLAWWSRWITEGWFPWESDGWPFWSASHHLSTWWTARHEPNVLLVHYADLKARPGIEIRRIGAFLGLHHSDDDIDEIAQATDFDTMKKTFVEREESAGGPGSSLFEGGIDRFFYKGTNGRWAGVLGRDELAQYETKMASLDPGFRDWLERGRDASDLT